MERNEIELSTVVTLSEEDLLEKIGSELLSDRKHAAPPGRTHLVERGRKWLQTKYSSLQSTVCGARNVREYVQVESNDQKLILAVAELIISICGVVSPITVATLLVKRGLACLCQDLWSDHV